MELRQFAVGYRLYLEAGRDGNGELQGLSLYAGALGTRGQGVPVER